MKAVRGRMLARAGTSGLLYVAELVNGAAVPKMDHLVCFLPGLLALGHLHGINTGALQKPLLRYVFTARAITSDMVPARRSSKGTALLGSS